MFTFYEKQASFKNEKWQIASTGTAWKNYNRSVIILKAANDQSIALNGSKTVSLGNIWILDRFMCRYLSHQASPVYLLSGWLLSFSTYYLPIVFIPATSAKNRHIDRHRTIPSRVNAESRKGDNEIGQRPWRKSKPVSG